MEGQNREELWLILGMMFSGIALEIAVGLIMTW